MDSESLKMGNGQLGWADYALQQGDNRLWCFVCGSRCWLLVILNLGIEARKVDGRGWRDVLRRPLRRCGQGN